MNKLISEANNGIIQNIINDKITKFNAGVNGEFYLKTTAPGNSQIADLADAFTEENL